MQLMPNPSKLCSACHGALQSGLDDVAEKTLLKYCTHHSNFTEFQDAAAQDCYICARLWASIDDYSLANCLKDPAGWTPFRCWLERRPWAPETYGVLYWHIRYLVFDTQLLDLKYRGNVFCLFPRNDREPSTLEDNIPEFESSTSSVKVHEQANGWYKVCCESHKTCQRIGSQGLFAPSRLIEVGAKGDNSWKLCLYPEDIAHPPKYLTLSYRWTQNPTILLLGSTIENFRQGAPIDGLPKTFQDAISVARYFKIRYLWIDSLCIIQDSPKDWARESVLMHEVYANSACNIAASASDGPDGGLFRSRVAKDSLLGHIQIDFPNQPHKKYDIWDQFYMDRLTQGPLTNRGWVFQERVLSPRVLYFSENQIVWECSEMNKCETFPNWSPYPSEPTFTHGLKTICSLFESGPVRSYFPLSEEEKLKKMRPDVYDQWSHLVRAYSRCVLTCPDDRLIAMSGIAEMFKKHSGDEYLAGLWRSRVVEGLNWVVIRPYARPQNPFRVPSWSWAAVDSVVIPQKINLPRDDDLVKIINVTVDTPTTTDGWRHVNGLIELRGCLTKAAISQSLSRSSTAENIILKLADLPCSFFAYPDFTDTAFEERKTLYILPLRSTMRISMKELDGTNEKLLPIGVIILEGLILEPVSEGNCSYRRVGHFVVDKIEHIGFFGLQTGPPIIDGKPNAVVVDEKKTEILTIV